MKRSNSHGPTPPAQKAATVRSTDTPSDGAQSSRRGFLAGAMATLSCVTTSGYAQTAPTTADPVKLGVVLDMSGPQSDATGAGSVMAARMAIEDFGGKLLARPIQLLTADHQNKPDIAASTAARWFDAEGMTAILDVSNSAAALAVMSVADQRKRVTMLSAPAALAIINQNCISTAVDYTYTTYGWAQVVGRALVQQGGKTWFFITTDYTFGHALQSDTTAVVQASGGKVLGSVKAPLGNADYSSMLITAQQSNADVIVLALGAGDAGNALKQAAEFGMTGKKRIVLLGTAINDIDAIGLETAQGVYMPDAFYWDANDETRAFSARYYDRMRRMPNMVQAGLYSSTMHYLRAVTAAGTTDAAAVMSKIRETPVNDFFAKNGHVRPDGLMAHDLFLFQVKKPSESKRPWDYYDYIATIPSDQVSPPLAQSLCPLVTRKN